MIAAIGLVLQTGVIVLAGVGVWMFDWNLNEANGSAKNYPPSMYIAGTLLLCTGMWSCAALIGQTTDEIRFRRRVHKSAPRSRLLWLQPGPQVIGDQSFDPYAYFENPKKDPLRVWTSSSKNFPEIFELYTFFAIVATLAGYIIQFIALRGMKGWVSLAQIGITIVMSLLRGRLRIKRIGRNDNELAKLPDLVAGHELDWLALKLFPQTRDGDSFWHLTGRHENARASTRPSEKSAGGRIPNDKLSTTTKAEGQTEANSQSTARKSDLSDQFDATRSQCKYLYQARVRLAHLTGNASFQKMNDSEYQIWEDKYVKVHTKAGNIATAICTAAAELSKMQPDREIRLRIEAASVIKAQSPYQPQMIDITLRPPQEFSTSGWRMDSAQLEAVLGLWGVGYDF